MGSHRTAAAAVLLGRFHISFDCCWPTDADKILGSLHRRSTGAVWRVRRIRRWEWRVPWRLRWQRRGLRQRQLWQLPERCRVRHRRRHAGAHHPRHPRRPRHGYPFPRRLHLDARRPRPVRHLDPRAGPDSGVRRVHRRRGHGHLYGPPGAASQRGRFGKVSCLVLGNSGG